MVFPAHAGMSPLGASSLLWWKGFPRSRGDEPRCQFLVFVACEFSPLTRG